MIPFHKKRALHFALLFAFFFVFAFPPSLPAPEADEDISIQEAVFNLPLCYRLTPSVLDFYGQTARSVDYVWLEPDRHGLALEIPRGRILFEFGSCPDILSLPSLLRNRGEYFALGRDVDVSEAVNLKALANFYNKKTALAPDGDRALAENAALASDLAPYADLFVIRAERWMEEDSTPDLDMLMGNVHAVAEAVRAVNPNIHFQIWLGQPVEGDRLTVERLYRALSRLVELDPRDIGSFGLERNDSWSDPEHGNNLLVQTQFFARKTVFSRPGTPAPPRNFRASEEGLSTILLTWTDASDDEAGFLLLRSRTAGRPPAPVEGPYPAADVESRRDTVPIPGTYCYWLCAFNSQGLSEFSGFQFADTLGHGANLPPRFEPAPDVVAQKGIPVEFRLFASDPEEDSLSYSLSICPAGMIIDPVSGTVSWLPSVSGRFCVSATVTDGQAADFLWFEIEVRDNT
ncbi:MAG: hypothetical protein JW747_06725 [Candidatus Aminicenantes bacterium]|nr:hypothetical protein [Candidatus Aminicenantes bacterium]